MEDLKSRLVLFHEKETAIEQLVADDDSSTLAGDIRSVLKGEPPKSLGVR